VLTDDMFYKDHTVFIATKHTPALLTTHWLVLTVHAYRWLLTYPDKFPRPGLEPGQLRVPTLLVTKNYRSFPGLSRTSEAFFQGRCHEPAMFKYSAKQQLKGWGVL